MPTYARGSMRVPCAGGNAHQAAKNGAGTFGGSSAAITEAPTGAHRSEVVR